MDPADKELLILRRPELVENIDVTNGLFTHLLSRKVLNKRMVQTITYNNPPDRQVEELLDLLPKRGPNAFKLFCDSLVATDQQDVVTNILQKKDGVETSSSSSSLATASVPASPLPDAVAETADVSLPGGVPVASASSSAPALGSSPLPASVQASSLSASDPSSLDPLLTSSPTTPHKRKPVKSAREASENDDKSHLASPSETDSSSVKRICTDSGSVICIRGDNENVIKIYSPQQADKKGNHSQDKRVFESSNPQRSFAIPKLLPGSEATADQGACRTDEIRYVMKHFIQNERDEDGRQAENVRLATSMLSNLPQEYLKLLSTSQPSLSKMTRDEDFSHDLLSERLSRCDSTDTMETRKPKDLRLDANKKPAEVDQPDQSVVRVGSMVTTVPPGVALGKALDYTDGPLSVHVEECSHQFYNLNKDKSYRMIGMPRGQALIINVNEVSEKPPRRGTDIDRDNLNNLLTQLHFQVTIYNDNDDLTALGMVEKLREFAARTEHASSDACIICLLSHGEEGFMFGTDGKKIPLEEIFLLFDNRHCPALLNKPKIFFIQACRGGMLDHGVKVQHDEPDGGTAPVHNNNMVQHPSMSDMLICYPTLQGYYAWRNRERGSWYIEAVVKIFMKYAKCEDICAMLNRVNSDVSRKVSRTPQLEMDRMSQMSEYKSSLRQPYLFFFPGIGAPSVK